MWENILAWMPAIVALIAGVVTVVVRFLPDRTRREPSWNEVVTENRALRDELNDLKTRFDNFETKTNVRIGALSNMLHASAAQWPESHPGPYFESKDLGALELTDVPYVWRNRTRPA